MLKRLRILPFLIRDFFTFKDEQLLPPLPEFTSLSCTLTTQHLPLTPQKSDNMTSPTVRNHTPTHSSNKQGKPSKHLRNFLYIIQPYPSHHRNHASSSTRKETRLVGAPHVSYNLLTLHNTQFYSTENNIEASPQLQ
jgi:hypothetical protein